VLLSARESAAQTAGLKLQIQLVWGTTDDHSPNPKHKPVQADVQAKLKGLPLKWTHYFEVNRQDLELPPSSANRVPLSEKCAIEVRRVGESNLEVTLFGKGKETLKRTQALPRGEMLVLGGNAPNSTGWLVVLKRTD
jgi:hypothetical protein